MTVTPESFFEDHFIQLTKQSPYPWQRKLFLRFVAPQAELWPEVVDLPTGSGKTSVLRVWLLALAWSIRTETFSVPRRLAWIVNRRVVVDQVTTEVEEILESLDKGDSELRELLRSISISGVPLAASTLRGQLADNGAWSRDPSTPAVVVGTVDMIGSRLLFRGFRAGRYYRPMHAGLLGVDTLIVNDEAHLSPALARLLTEVWNEHPAGRIPGKCFKILLLSATHDGANLLQPFDHDPEEDVAGSDAFRKVFHAPKSLTLHETANLNELNAAVWKLATESAAVRTCIFIESPENAAKLADRLCKDGRPCALLTGTMRGFERDRLLKDNEVFKRFLEREAGTEPVWLVSTSAGEVGINFSCERLITSLTEADHLLQRFGRLNRFGYETPGEAYVVFRNPSDKEPRLQRTLEYLRELAGDVSCAKIWHNKPPMGARTEQPMLARLEARHIDMWAQTTYPDRFVPAVESWLHGKQESEVPDAEVAWRSDVAILAEWNIEPDEIRDVLEYYPVQSQETLSEPASRVAGKLSEIAERIGPDAAAQTKLILVESDGTPSICDLAYVVKQTEAARSRDYLDHKMLLLPDGIGSVIRGMFHSGVQSDPSQTMDVADRNESARRIRFLFVGDESAIRLPTNPTDDASRPTTYGRADLMEYASGTYKPALVVEHPTEDDRRLIYFGARPAGTRGTPADVHLSVHHASVAKKAKCLACKVGLDSLMELYWSAGGIHDSGKDRHVWQRAVGWESGPPLAKTKAPANLRLIDGYRHELGSLIEAVRNPEGPAEDLLLHLVASHHAGGRPHFARKQYDRKYLTQSAKECPEIARRYARLQTRYGAWGLAYLEAVFKCADGMVSREEGEPTSA